MWEKLTTRVLVNLKGCFINCNRDIMLAITCLYFVLFVRYTKYLLKYNLLNMCIYFDLLLNHARSNKMGLNTFMSHSIM